MKRLSLAEKGKGPLGCMNCHKQFKDAEERILHAKTLHKVHLTAFPCNACRVAGFSALERLKMHQKLHCLGPNWEAKIMENPIPNKDEYSPIEGTELRESPADDTKDDHENVLSPPINGPCSVTFQESVTGSVRLSARKRTVSSSETRLQNVPMQSRARSNIKIVSPDGAVTSSKHMNNKITRSSLNRFETDSSHIPSLSATGTAKTIRNSSKISENFGPLTPAARKAMKSRKLSLSINAASVVGKEDIQAPHTTEFVVAPNELVNKILFSKSDSTKLPNCIVKERVEEATFKVESTKNPAFLDTLKSPGRSGKTNDRMLKSNKESTLDQDAIGSANPKAAKKSKLIGANGKALPDTGGHLDTRNRRSIGRSDQTVKAINRLKAEFSQAESSSSSCDRKDLIATSKKESYSSMISEKVDFKPNVDETVSSIFCSPGSIKSRVPRCPRIKKIDGLTKTTEEKSASDHVNKTASETKVNAETEVQNESSVLKGRNSTQSHKTVSRDGSNDEQQNGTSHEKLLPSVVISNENRSESHEESSSAQVAEVSNVNEAESTDPENKVASRKPVVSKHRTMPLKGQKSNKVNNQSFRSWLSEFPQRGSGSNRGSDGDVEDLEQQPRGKKMSRLQLEIQALIREEEVLNPKGIRPSRKLNAFIRNKALLESQGTITILEGKEGTSTETSPDKTELPMDSSVKPLAGMTDEVKSIPRKGVTERETNLTEVHPIPRKLTFSAAVDSKKLPEESPAVYFKVEVASGPRRAKKKIQKSTEPTADSLKGDFAARTGSAKKRAKLRTPKSSYVSVFKADVGGDLQINKLTEPVSAQKIILEKGTKSFLNSPEKSEESNSVVSKNESDFFPNAANKICCSTSSVEDRKPTEPSTVAKQEVDLRSNESKREMKSPASSEEQGEVIRVASPGSVCGFASNTLESDSVYPKRAVRKSFDSARNVEIANRSHVAGPKSSLDSPTHHSPFIADVCVKSGTTNNEQTSSSGELSQAKSSEETASSGRLALKRLRESLVIHEEVQPKKRAKYVREMVLPAPTSPNMNSNSPAVTTTLTPVKVALIDWNNFISGGPRKSRLSKDHVAIHKADSNSEVAQLKSLDSTPHAIHSADSSALTNSESKISSLKRPAEENEEPNALPVDNTTRAENPETLKRDSTSDDLSDASSDTTLPATRSVDADSMPLATVCGEAKVSQSPKSRPSTVLSCPRCHQSGFATKSELKVHRVNSCRRAASLKYKNKTAKSRLTRFYCPGCADRKTDHRTPEALLAHLSHCGNAKRGKSRRGAAVVQSPWPAPLTGPSTTFGCPVCGYMFASASRLEQHRIDENHF